MGRSALLLGLQHMVMMAIGQMTTLLRMLVVQQVSMARLAGASSAMTL